MIVFCDSQNVIHLEKDQVYFVRAKFIKINFILLEELSVTEMFYYMRLEYI